MKNYPTDIKNYIQIISQTLVKSDPKISEFNLIMDSVMKLADIAEQKINCKSCEARNNEDKE